MKMKLLKGVKRYWIKPSKHPGDCPLCGSRMDYCVMGECCSNKKCKYTDGTALLTKTQALKYKDKIMK